MSFGEPFHFFPILLRLESEPPRTARRPARQPAVITGSGGAIVPEICSELADFELDRGLPRVRQIHNHLQRLILEGRLKAGQRIPTNTELANLFGVSCTAVQEALGSLTRSGLIQRSPRRGTFVSERKTLRTVALCFGTDLNTESSYFHRVLREKLERALTAKGVRCSDFWCSDPLEIESEGDGLWEPLFHQLADRQLGGIIQVHLVSPRLDAAVRASRTPRVLFEGLDPASDFTLDINDFIKQSVDHLIKEGRKRITFIHTIWHGAVGTGFTDLFLRLTHRPEVERAEIVYCVFSKGGSEVEALAFERTCQYLEDCKKTNKMPDCLVVNDDIAMRGVALALFKAGIAVPEQMRIIVMTTEGVNLHYGFPVARYQFHPQMLVDESLSRLDTRVGNPDATFPCIQIKGSIHSAAM